MKKLNTQALALAALVVGLGMASSAHADFTFGTSGVVDGLTTTGAAGGAADGDKAALAYGTGTGSLTLSGAYATNGTGNSGFASAWSTSTAGTTYVSSGAQLNYYTGNGIGMASDGQVAPNHAMDNNGNTESMLLSFGQSTIISSIGIGYVSGDADVSLFRYTGTSAPTLNGTTATLAGMQAAGWELVGNYGDLAVDTTSPYNAVNAGNKGSSWWLISAYNSSYGAATSGTVNQGDDYFKLFAVGTSACTSTATGVCTGGTPGTNVGGVPEPTSLALVAIAGLGFLGARRRALKAGAAA